MTYVDVHAHLDHEMFKKDLDEVLKRAEQAGVKAIISNGTNRISNETVLKLANKYPIVKAAIGFDPIELLGLDHATGKQKVNINVDEELELIKKHFTFSHNESRCHNARYP